MAAGTAGGSGDPSGIRAVRRALGYLRSYKLESGGAFVALLCVTGANLITPLLIGRAIDDGIRPGNSNVLLAIVGGLVGVALARGLFTFLQGYLAERASQGVAYDLRNALFERIRRLSFSYYDRVQTGQLVTRLTNDVEQIRTFTGSGVVQLGNAAVMLVGTTFLLFYLDWRLAFVALAIIPPIIFVLVRFVQKIRPLFGQVQQILGRLNTVLQEDLSGVRVIRAFAREDYETERYRNVNDELLNKNLETVKTFSNNFPVIFFLSSLGTLGIVLFGGLQVIGGSLSIKLDDHDVRDVTLSSLRSQIEIVLQETRLFSGSVRDNIAFGKPDATNEEVREAARDAQADEFIRGLPEGYDTVIGERGLGLSGGQRQRVAIARALLVDPRLLILDDSTSAVDAETEARLGETLDRLMRERSRTVFVIAQRVSTVRDADLILALNEGKVAARGTHEELRRDSELYNEILGSQLVKQTIPNQKGKKMTESNSTPNAATSGTFAIGGDQDLLVNRLGFGAMRITGEGIWGEPEDPEEAKAVLRRALELGINMIDTADSYGPDVSERLIGETLSPYPDDVMIATKGGLVRPGPGNWQPNGRPEHLREACEGSLKRLNLETIDLYQLHRIDPEVPAEESLGVLSELRDEGKIRYVGLSEVGVEEIQQAREIVSIVSVQNRYNLTDRGSEDVLDYCEQEGIAFIPWFPLATGKLTESGGPLDEISARHDARPSQIALAWLLHRSPVILPIPGTSSVAHLEENAVGAEIKLSDEEVAELNEAA